MMAPFSWLVLAALALDATAVNSAPNVCHCCTALAEADGLKGKVYLPDSTAYHSRLDSYWSLSAALPPWCMVQPASTEDVAETIKTLTANKCPFGIRAGGHGSFPLSNSVKRGVTIDFGLMNSTTWDSKSKIASIQPGTDWQRVYETLATNGVVVPGGRVSTVGIAGYLTGGGLSFQQASHGLACDNVANFEVVLANGTVTNANAESNPDLWHALKGGSGNFGLVTRFDMYGIEYKDPSKPVMWGGNLAFDVRSAPAMANAMVKFTDNVHKDENSSVILAWTYSPQTASETVINAAVYNTEARAKAPAFEPFYSVKGMYNDTARVTDMTELTAELGFGQVAGYHYIWFDSAFQNDARVIKFASDRFAQLNKDLERLAPSAKSQLNTNMFLQPLSKSMADKGVKNGGNSVGLNRFTDKHNGILFLVTTAVKDAKSEQIVLPRVSAFVDEVESYAKSLGLYWPWKYLNYARGSQDAIASYGETSIAKLCAAAAKYDPDSVFQKLRGSGFKLSCKETHSEL